MSLPEITTVSRDANIDRQVRILKPDSENGRQCRLSEISTLPRVVILGEPGIGKSTALAREAMLASSKVITVRKLLNTKGSPAEHTLFIDALDQSRTRDSADDKIDALAEVVRGVGRWRITCRSMDWRGQADLQALLPNGSFDDVYVVQILPLEANEACSILTAIGNTLPVVFLEKARINGAIGFTKSPLMLKLLHKVIEHNGQWPVTRFNLFDDAIKQLVAETNEGYATVSRASIPDLLDAAGIVSILLLTSGAEGVWRSNVPPSIGDEALYISRSDCGVEDRVLDDLLACSLFRGEGHIFEPAHRSIAEFLAGGALAIAVLGRSGQASYPLSRAVSIITGYDGLAPTELRGVHAWFGVHLAQLGQTSEAKQLVITDPPSALFYGDLASFGTDIRRVVLDALPENDPFFRSELEDDTSLSGLAKEELAIELRNILENKKRTDHMASTVLDALVGGCHVPSLDDLIEGIVIDVDQAEWRRSRSIDILLNVASDRNNEVCRLFKSISLLPHSHDNERLRRQLLVELPSSLLDANDVADVLIVYDSLGEDDRLLPLFNLQKHLQELLLPEVLNVLSDRQSLPLAGAPRSTDTMELLTLLFVNIVDRSNDLEPKQILKWAQVLISAQFETLPDAAIDSVQRWIDAAQGRDIGLFNEVEIAFKNTSFRPWQVYGSLFGQKLSYVIVENLIQRAESEFDRKLADSLVRDISVILSTNLTEATLELYWSFYEKLNYDARYKDCFEQLTVCIFDRLRLTRMDTAREKSRRDGITHRWRLRQIMRDANGVRTGKWSSHISDLARLYFSSSNVEGCLDHIKELYGDVVSNAITEFWTNLSEGAIYEIDISKMGEVYGNNEHYVTDLSSVVGLHIRLKRGDIQVCHDVPITVLIAVLMQQQHIGDATIRNKLVRQAIESIGLSQENLVCLFEFWTDTLEAKALYRCGLPSFNDNVDLMQPYADHLSLVLSQNLFTESIELKGVIQLVGKLLDRASMIEIVENALKQTLSDEIRGVWLSAGIEVDFERFGEFLQKTDLSLETLSKALAENSLGAYKRSPLIIDDVSSRIQRHGLAIELLGAHVDPNDDLVDRHYDERSRSESVWNSIKVLGADSTLTAIQITTRLLKMGKLEQWYPRLRHTLAKQSSKRRDETFIRPDASKVRAALNGGPPLNVSDLRAIVEHELKRQASVIQSGSTTPWKQFWNTDSNGKAIEPRVENTCRDRILERLNDCLQPYHITGAFPEAQRAQNTRVDMLIFTGAGANLPIEVKRQSHKNLWTAASTQLKSYTNSPGAEGIGIYLVLWFGLISMKMPARPDGGARPASAKDLEQQLVDDLPSDIKNKISVIVFDVENKQPE